MSELTNTAIDYIEKSPFALLVTVGEENRPSTRLVGPVVNDGLVVYFVTRIDSRKAGHMKSNPFVTLVFQKANQLVEKFTSVTINGHVSIVPEGDEFKTAVEKLGKVSPGYLKYINKDNFKSWAFYKVSADTLEFVDHSKSTRPIIEQVD